MTDDSRTEFLDRAEALERRLTETGDFVESQWQEIDRRAAHVREIEAERLAFEQRRHALDLERQSLLRLRRMEFYSRSLALVFLFLGAAAVVVLGSVSLASGWAPLPLSLGAALVAFLATLFFELRGQRALDHQEPQALAAMPLLLVMAAADRPIPRSRIPDLVARTPQRLEDALDEAQRQGLVEQQGDCWVLTPAGRTAVADLKETVSRPDGP